MTNAKKLARGFAVMDPARARQIASMGGRAAHANGRAHEFTSEEARAAGRKGGLARRASQEPQSTPAPKSTPAPVQRTPWPFPSQA